MKKSYRLRGNKILGLLVLLGAILTGMTASAKLSFTTKQLPADTNGMPYSQTIVVSGGQPPYTWKLLSGSFPDSLTLNPTNGVLSGTTQAAAWELNYPFSAYVGVTDSAGASTAASFAVSLVAPPAAGSGPSYSLQVVNGTVNGASSGSFAANANVTIIANAAPAGQVFKSWTGATVANPLGATTSLVMPASNIIVTATYAAVQAPPVQYALTVVNGTVNGASSGSFAANADVTIIANAAPAGQVFKSWTGATVLNPVSATTTLTMPAMAANVTATFASVAQPLQPLSIAQVTLPSPMAGTPYSQTLTATGGQPPYTWAVQAGGLPDLLTLNPTTGQISGMPTASGSWVFSYTNLAYIVVTDSASHTAGADFALCLVPSTNSYFTLTVSNGTQTGLYLTNSVVGIVANPAPAGEVFVGWTGATVASPSSPSTTLIMPESNLTVTATYGIAPPSYPLTVVNGTVNGAASGSFLANANVPITANPAPAGEVFLSWTGANVANPQKASTTLLMPAGPVTVTANYGVPPPKFTLVVLNGYGGGNYPANTPVNLTAEQASLGRVFANWSGPVVFANPLMSNTTMIMPSNDVTVTANYGFAPPAIPNVPQPVTNHPRLWITPADLPRLQGWAAATNPIYSQCLAGLGAECHEACRTQFFINGVPNTNYPDPGDSQGYVGLISEQYMMVLAFDSLIDPNPANRIQYAQDAHDIMMYAMDLAVLGPDTNQPPAPFRDPVFPTYNRARFGSEAWPLTLDWLYNATNFSGQLIFSAQDKATIRNVFLLWAYECNYFQTAGGNSPQPFGVMNSHVLLPGGNANRWAANNYYGSQARLVTLMSLAIDPADDPPINTNAEPAQLANTLRSYILNATGAWLYQQYAMFGEPAEIESAYGLPSTASVGIISGGLPPEGMLYGESTHYLIEELLALKTAGFADPALSGPQIALANDPPVWSRFTTGFLSSLVPNQQVVPSESWLGPVYEFASYGDILRMYVTPDFLTIFGSLNLLDRQNNDYSRMNAERWFGINAPEGGAASLLSRCQDPWTWGVQDSIFAFLLLDPSATTTDPRTNYATAFYDPGQGRLIDRTDWTPNATLYSYRCSWESINHQQADANMFELYRNGEWLTKGVANYDDNFNGQSSDYHNTLTLQNWCPIGTPTNFQWNMPAFWANGSQWPWDYNNGDPVTYTSVQSNYDYSYGDTTQLYNVPSSVANCSGMDIQHASRSILWLKPDYIVVYDRANSLHPGLFKQFNLTFPNQPTLSSNVISTTTPRGQSLFITSLLPASEAFTSININGLLTTVADLEPCQYHMVLEDTNCPPDERFLNVLQGADPGVSAENVTLVHSASGTAMDGAMFGNTVVMFVVNSTVPFNGTTYTVPANVTQHFITGCAPNASYNVVSAVTASGLVVTITPAANGVTSDSAGVLAVGF